VEKVWLKSYPEGVPEFIDTSEYKSLADLFDKSIATFKDRPAYTNLGRSISYGELDEYSRDFGAYLTNQAGLVKGDRIAIMLKDSDAKAIVILENFAHTLADIIDETNVKTVITTRIGDLASFPKSLLVNFVVKHVKKMVPKQREYDC